MKNFSLEIFFNRTCPAALDKLKKCIKIKDLDEIEESMKTVSSEHATLESCFAENELVEQLSKENTWYCKNC